LSTVHPCSFKQMCLLKNAKSCKPVDTILKWRTSVDLHVGIFFLSALFCMIFFFLDCMLHDFFFLSTWIAGNYFSKSSNPPPPQKSNGPPLRKQLCWDLSMWSFLWWNVAEKVTFIVTTPLIDTGKCFDVAVSKDNDDPKENLVC
jgi:hypothetical protein